MWIAQLVNKLIDCFARLLFFKNDGASWSYLIDCSFMGFPSINNSGKKH